MANAKLRSDDLKGPIKEYIKDIKKSPLFKFSLLLNFEFINKNKAITKNPNIKPRTQVFILIINEFPAYNKFDYYYF